MIPLDYFEHLIRTRERPAQQLPISEPTGITPIVTPPDNAGLPRGFAPTNPERIARLKQGADDGRNEA